MHQIISFIKFVAEVLFEFFGDVIFYLPEIVFSLIFPAILVILILLTGVIYSIFGIAKFKWWTLLLFFVFVVFSFPFRIVLNANYFNFITASTQYELAPWIIKVFCFMGFLFPLLWIFLLLLIKAFNGVSFKNKRARKFKVYSLICILSLITLSEEALYPGLIFVLRPETQVASTVSPDHERKIIVFYQQYQNYYYKIVSQENSFFPILARKIGVISKELPPRGLTDIRLKFLWSNNSDVVSLSHKERPIWVYQFSKNRQLDIDSDDSEENFPMAIEEKRR